MLVREVVERVERKMVLNLGGIGGRWSRLPAEQTAAPPLLSSFLGF